ncbi:MAG: response regulator [Paludibacter sp.]
MKTDNVQNQQIPNILIVDDDEFNLIVLGEILKRSNYKIHSVTNGILALQASEDIRPDLILLDIMMPEMDGYEVCRRLKESENLSDIPVIFISSLTDSRDIVKALTYGGVDYITKPFNAEVVLARVNTHLKLYQQSRELLKLNAKLKDSQDQLSKFAAHLLIIREEERMKLSTEIHDKIGQILIALKIDMGMWEKKLLFLSENNRSQEIVVNFNMMVDILDNTIKSVRKIMNELKSDDLELLGFIEAAKLFSIEFEIINKINCKIETSISKLELNELQKVALYRILQESLSNIALHAEATSVVISLYIHEQNLVMEIVDNGIGIDISKKTQKDAYGLTAMKERVEILHGKLTITGKPTEGTQVKVEMPYQI